MKKTVIIVGAGPGLGNAIAREFASHEFRVGLISRNADKLAGYQAEFEAAGIEVSTRVADAAHPETLTAALHALRDEFGTPDALVYNIGVTEPDGDREITGDFLVERFRVDVASAWDATNAVMSDEFAAKKGAILLTGGGFAKSFQPIPFLVALCIDKAALNGLNIMLHDRLAPSGIFVGSVIVSGAIVDGDAKNDPAMIAKQFWKLYTERDNHELVY